MLNRDDIESIVQSGEGYNVEFKVRVPNKVKELIEEVCAFANAAGGVLLLGVDDNNNIQGICTGFDVDTDLDETYFEEFRIEAGLSKTVSRQQIIQSLRLILPDGSFKNGGTLFFGKQPEYFIEKAVIRCIAFEGITKTQIIDDKVFGGPLMNQYQQSMQWLKSKLNVGYEIEGGGPRKEIWEIPETAFKETIINALSHRDYYDKGARITIILFLDRIEISSPGGLTSAISLAEFGKKSHSRNPLIFGLFVRIDMVEQVGSGIGRIKDSLKAAALAEPVFKTDGMFTVVFKRAYFSGNISKKIQEKTGEKIVRLISEDPGLTIKDLADTIGITEKGIEYQLSKLTKEGHY